VNDAASLVAVLLPKRPPAAARRGAGADDDDDDDDDGDGETAPPPEHAVVYDVATARRLARVPLGEPHVGVQLLDETLLITSTPCAGPCSSSTLVSARTGRRLAAVGGADPINTSMLSPARVSGDVFAFNDHDSAAIVYQDLRTGRVVERFDHEMAPCEMDCGVQMLHVGGRLAIVETGDAAGDVTLYDARGDRVARHQLPRCEGASP
jgi:hypothetical protein